MGMQTVLKRNEYGRLAREARTVGGTVSKQTAERILTGAQDRVHVITGATRASGHIVESGLGYDVVFSEGAVWEEYGNRFRPPHPFLTPESEAAWSGHVQQLREGLSL